MTAEEFEQAKQGLISLAAIQFKDVTGEHSMAKGKELLFKEVKKIEVKKLVEFSTRDISSCTMKFSKKQWA